MDGVLILNNALPVRKNVHVFSTAGYRRIYMFISKVHKELQVNAVEEMKGFQYQR
jgi:hypothetical protein